MNNNELKDIIESARIARGLSQRELSREIGLSQSTYNDTINGKIKKVDVEILRKIAEGLDLSLEKLLQASGYKEVFDFFGKDQFSDKSTRDLIDKIKEYQKSELELLSFDANKRNIVRKTRGKMFDVKENLIKIKENGEGNYTLDNAIEELEQLSKDLIPVQEKYDYSNLPKKK